jgi:hypothetical protein
MPLRSPTSMAPSLAPLPVAATHLYKGLECAPRDMRLFVNVAQAGSMVFPGETVVATLLNDSSVAKRVAVSLVGAERMKWSFFSRRLTKTHGVAASVLASGVGVALAATVGVGFAVDLTSKSVFDERIPVEKSKELYELGPTRATIESGASRTFSFTVPKGTPPSFVTRGGGALGDTGIFHELVIEDGTGERFVTAIRVGVGCHEGGRDLAGRAFSMDSVRVAGDTLVHVPGACCFPTKMRVAFSVPSAWLLKSARCQEWCVQHHACAPRWHSAHTPSTPDTPGP